MGALLRTQVSGEEERVRMGKGATERAPQWQRTADFLVSRPEVFASGESCSRSVCMVFQGRRLQGLLCLGSQAMARITCLL